MAQIVEDNLLLSDVLNNVGSCLYLHDEVDEALTFFERAFTLAGRDTLRKASSLYNQGLCSARKEDFDRARILWEESLALYQELKEPLEIKKVEHNLRQIDRKQKGEHLEKAYRKALQIGMSEDIEKSYRELAEFQAEDLIASTE